MAKNILICGVWVPFEQYKKAYHKKYGFFPDVEDPVPAEFKVQRKEMFDKKDLK